MAENNGFREDIAAMIDAGFSKQSCIEYLNAHPSFEGSAKSLVDSVGDLQ